MKKIFIIMFVLAGVFAQAQTSVWDGTRRLWTKGSGTQDDPFLIESASNLAYLSYMVGKGFNTEGLYFKLTTDIDLDGSEKQQWIPIGMQNDAFYEDGCERQCVPVTLSPYEVTFRGHFDGDNHSISNIYINKENGAAGLFGVLTGSNGSAVVENVFVTNGFVKGSCSGGIVGTCNTMNDAEVIVSRCWNGADIESSNCAGGIVGENADKIHNCYNVGSVYGASSAGGIVGSTAKEIAECYNTGAVTGEGYGGGILGGGTRSRGVIVENCYNAGEVSVNEAHVSGSTPGSPVGGVVGFSWMGGGNAMTNCYNVGTVFCGNYAPGALVGGFNGTVNNSYYLNTCGAEGEGIAKASGEMKDPAFVNALNFETNVWSIDTLNYNNGYPILGNNNLAVDEYAMQTLSVYPNPSNGQFTVEGTGVLRVYNTLGQMMMTKEIREKHTLRLPKGLYFIHLDGENGVEMVKIVVK